MGRIPTDATLATGETVASAAVATDETLASAGATDATLASAGATSVQPAPTDLPIVDAKVYVHLDEVGRGGLGRILRAKDLRTGRIVAIKEMRVDSPDAAARFVREALVTANLQHPAIVPVYEVGRWSSGQPFYAMKLVTGKPLADVVKAAVDPDERLALLPHLIAVADALAYAHGERVIHRDLKPANVMVGGHGETVVIDWGLARKLGDQDVLVSAPVVVTAAPGETVVGAVLGTPQYMAPEQARGERVDERVDVYAIGAMLYQVLAGQPPFEGIGTVAGVLDAVRTRAPDALATIAPWAPRDLVAIVEHAMARDLDERYSTAAALAQDLRRFATGQLVTAHNYTPGERLRRFTHRYRAVIAASAIAFATVIVVGAVSLNRVLDERAAARTAEAAERDARGEADRKRAETQSILAGSYVMRAKSELDAMNPVGAAPLIEAAMKLERASGDVRTLTSAVASQLPVFHDPGLPASPQAVLLANGDALVASIDDVSRRSLADGVVRWSLPVTRSSDLLVLDAETAMITTLTGVTLVSIATGAEIARLGNFTDVTADTELSALVTEGRWLAIKSPTGTADVWDLASRTRRGLVRTNHATGYAVASPDGRRVLITGFGKEGSTSGLYDIASGRSLGEICTVAEACGAVPPAVGADVIVVARDITAHGGQVRILEWDGRTRHRVALDSLVRAVEIEPVAGGAVVVTLDGNVAMIGLVDGRTRWMTKAMPAGYGLQLDPARHRVWVFGLTGSIAALDDRTGTVLGRWSTTRSTWDLKPSLFDDRIVLLDGTLQVVWTSVAMSAAVVAPTNGRVWRTAWLPDGRLATGSEDGTIAIHDAKTGEATKSWRGHDKRVSEMWALADGRLVTAGRDRKIAIWDVASATPTVVLDDVGYRAAIAPDAARLVSADESGRVVLHEMAEPRTSRVLETLSRPILALRWSPDGRFIATIDESGAVRVWRADTGALVQQLPGRPAGRAGGFDLAFSPDSRWVAAGRTGRAVLLDLVENRSLELKESSEQQAFGVAFSADSSLVAISFDGKLNIWRTGTGEAVQGLAAPGNALGVAFSPDGTQLATASNDHRVRLWDLGTGLELAAIQAPDELYSLRWGPNGRLAMTTLAQGLLWTPPSASADLDQLADIVRCRSGQALTPTGVLVPVTVPADCVKK